MAVPQNVSRIVFAESIRIIEVRVVLVRDIGNENCEDVFDDGLSVKLLYAGCKAFVIVNLVDYHAIGTSLL